MKNNKLKLKKEMVACMSLQSDDLLKGTMVGTKYTLFHLLFHWLVICKFSNVNFPCHYCTGGCGAMYEIFVESEDFRGKRQVQQHRLVNKVSPD